MIPVSSSWIAGIDYLADATLWVHLRNGHSYWYPNQPPELVHAFLAAGSKGEFFNEHVKLPPPAKAGRVPAQPRPRKRHRR